MAFKDGEFLEIEYTAKDAQSGATLATTDEAAAKQAEIYDEHVRYGPVLVVIGSNAVVKGLERELKGMDIGENRSFVLKPEDAFGERNENLVKVMKESDFKQQNLRPYPGMRLNIDNAPATVKSVGSGRVVVDMNHPDAGKSITYEVKIIKKIEKEEEKIEKLSQTYGLNPTSVKAESTEAEIYFDNKVRKDSDYFINKASSLAAIFTYLKDVKRVVVKEEYLNLAEEKKDEKASEEKERS